MLFWIFQTSILSIILIFLVHYLINFFKSTLTVPKIKDLVNSPTKKYENIYNIIGNKTSYSDGTDINNMPHEIIPKEEMKNEMKTELKNFLKKQLKDTETDSLPENGVNYNSNYSLY
jgi:hypothetical protein